LVKKDSQPICKSYKSGGQPVCRETQKGALKATKVVLLARFHELQKLTGASFCRSGVHGLAFSAAPFLSEEGKTGDEFDMIRSALLITID
jgi:hypothetical protein